MESSKSDSDGFCGVCRQRESIYTCPRCAMHTCSLPCSKSHKLTQSCSGERDKAAYVPMNQYSWGTMVNDYTYLEEVGRKVTLWGRDIVQGAFWTSAVYANRGRRRGLGRGLGEESRESKSTPRASGRGNRDLLRMYLDARDIDMEMLPPGMQRRRVNQSSWDTRSSSPLMTVEFVFHRRNDTFAPRDSPKPLPFTLLTHRNTLDAKISEVIHRCVRNERDDIPPWVKSLITSLEDNGTELVYLICQHSDLPLNPVFKVYHRLNSTQSLLNALRNRTFVEYPTIDIWEQGDFTGAIVEADGTFVEEEGEGETRPIKRRLLDTAGGRKLMKSLLAGYTSNEEEKQDEDNVLDMLGGYGSNDESLGSVELEERHDSEGIDGIIDGPPTSFEHVRDILEHLGHDSFTEDQTQWVEEVGEVDWSDTTDHEAGLE